MKSKLQLLYRSEFIKVSSWSGIATVVRMITSLLTIKIVSKLIGPGGIALVGQFMNATAIFSVLGTGCISQGTTKYVVEFTDNKKEQYKIISNAIKLTLLSSFAVGIVLIALHRFWGYYIFKTDAYNSIIVFFGVSLLLYSMNITLISIINGLKLYSKLIKANIASSLLGLLITIPVVYFWGVYGALVSNILSQSLIIFITFIYIRKQEWVLEVLRNKWKLDKKTVGILGGFTLMTLVSTLLGPNIQLFIRGYIISNLSIRDAGIWEGINRLSSMYLMLITSSLSIYYLPRLSELKEKALLRNEIWNTFKIVVPLLAIFCVSVFLLRDVVIRVVFTQEFDRMRVLFPIQLMGDFFKISSWMIALLFWAKAKTQAFIITEITFSAILLTSSYMFINTMGFEGTVYGYALTSFLYLIVVGGIFRRTLFNFSR